MVKGISINVAGEFHAAHRLPGYSGPCGRLHGHTWEVIVSITPQSAFSELEDACPAGDLIMLDFGDIKEIWAELDHSYLNDTFENPTAEAIAWYIVECAVELMLAEGPEVPFVVEVILSETKHNTIRVSEFHDPGLYLTNDEPDWDQALKAAAAKSDQA